MRLYGQIEAVSEMESRYRVLDLQKPDVRAAVYATASAKSVYLAPVATSFQQG